MRTPDLNGSHALVTGGAGFIGSHVVDALLDAGASVTVFDDFSNGSLANLSRWLPAGASLEAPGSWGVVSFAPQPLGSSAPPRQAGAPVAPDSHSRLASHVSRLTVLKGDIRDLDACRQACGLSLGSPLPAPRFVFHHAALCSVQDSLRDPGLYFSVNAAGTANVFTAAHEAGVERIVYATSSAVYGDNGEGARREGTEKRPVSPYALSKVFNEETADLFGRCYGHAAVGLRYFNIFGPRQSPSSAYAGVIPLFFDAYLNGRRPKIFGDGLQTRDFAFVADAVRANLFAATAPPEACGRAYNIAGGSSITVRDLAGMIREVCGGGAEPEHLEARVGEVRHSLADISLAAKTLGYKPGVSLADGLARCLDYYKRMFAERDQES